MSLAADRPRGDVLVSRTTPLGDGTGLPDLLDRLPGHLPLGGGFAWVRGGEGFVGWGEAATVPVGTGPDRFARAAQSVSGLLAGADVEDEVGAWGSGPLAFGSFAFDDDASLSELVVPATVVGSAGGRAWLTRTGWGSAPDDEHSEPEAGIRPVATRLDKAALGDEVLDEASFTRAVESARAAIREGRLDKVVLSLQVLALGSSPFDHRQVLRKLAGEYPQCYTFGFRSFVGASPELLVRRQGRSVWSQPLAGSARRGATAAEDADLGERLLASGKDRWEHDLAVVTVVEALHPLCRTLRIQPEPSLLRLANVQHLATEVTGELSADPPPTALALAGAVHPTAAVCGSPSRKALALIRELEGPHRGRYAGPVGWVDAAGDGEWAIALRCAELSGATARLFAGCGIVSESDPAAELDEARLKLRPIRSALEID